MIEPATRNKINSGDKTEIKTKNSISIPTVYYKNWVLFYLNTDAI